VRSDVKGNTKTAYDPQLELYKQEIRDGKRTGVTYNGMTYYKASDGSIRSKTATTKVSTKSGSSSGKKAKKLTLAVKPNKVSIKAVKAPTTNVSLNLKSYGGTNVQGKFAKLKLGTGRRSSGKVRRLSSARRIPGV
jgi:hypothetical protein